ncbi:hypothetical protein H6G00_04820 [Leptolyngbya sp. FACHB-541]|uniref:hypothetical protein n=1 Tax=Leptolyngbya sp. FACHB-541 TaxID=2692810 RepID=UPI001684311D|nr:hypothetical protein [Leptolyngbya sp. FACHB-541]MBD1995940.1 hypothetical protein [Leptolyngbya sp. FACHB-541]
MTITQPKNYFQYVQEWDDCFLALFPHRFDYIWAEHSTSDTAVEWKTESRHPLSDRLIHQGTYLYGIRFGAETNYCLLDIDIGSLYHPRRDPFAISRIVNALEPLGLVSYIACTSSYSDGLHLYFPFRQTQSSWQLAIALACLLENAGFKLLPGQLEIFPNSKPYVTDGNLSLFNAHRLPLQVGSYLLNEAWQPIWGTSQTFAQQWQLSQERNDIDSKTLKQILKQAKRKHFGISGKAEKFINDLNAEIELGWTGYGQTNRLLGRITMRAYIFHHILSGGEPLQGDALVDEIVETARSLPGYEEWCRHQNEIEHRAQEWARCIENSHYFHFGDQSKRSKPEVQDPELIAAIDQSPSWNQRQSAATRDRIRRAIADLLEKDGLPARATARFQALLKYGVGGASLYRHRDLWHPSHFEGLGLTQTATKDSPVENPPDPPNFNSDSQLDCAEGTSNWHSPPSLLITSDGDNPSHQAFSDFTPSTPPPEVSNSSLDASAYASGSEPTLGVQYVQEVLRNIRASQEAFQEAIRLAQSQQKRIRSEAAQQRQVARMQQFLDSGDPILVAEGVAWAQINPGVLQDDGLPFSLFTDAGELGDRLFILTQIEARIGELRWSEEQVVAALGQRFAKEHLLMLTDLELIHWLVYLSNNPRK